MSGSQAAPGQLLLSLLRLVALPLGELAQEGVKSWCSASAGSRGGRRRRSLKSWW
eukprot:CAMPEP_0180799010 /NCGR_PEP_ID=MMETSP1038_2-20121128/58296_1 /TAXON_ID=632150 /ORGANISM="Azadinium spinosum, Strain 3D9" /LENGTH=54 /DNA_ID=CAMNT_0022838551 /DNA_START=119 /DNA_END=280 /DNA_ORIENTATION=+